MRASQLEGINLSAGIDASTMLSQRNLPVHPLAKRFSTTEKETSAERPLRTCPPNCGVRQVTYTCIKVFKFSVLLDLYKCCIFDTQSGWPVPKASRFPA